MLFAAFFINAQTPAPSGTWYKNATEKNLAEIKGFPTFDSNNVLNGWVDKDSLEVDLSNYYTKEETSEVISDSLSGYYTKPEVDTLFAKKNQIYTVVPNISENGKTANTGLSYDNLRNQYLVSYYDIDSTAQIWAFSHENLIPYTAIGTANPIPDNIIDVSPLLYRIQGIAYDRYDDTIWVLGQSTPGSSGVVNILVHIEYDGTHISTTNLNTLLSSSSFTNGVLAIDYVRNEIMYKPQGLTGLYYIDRTTLTLKATQTTFSTNECFGFYEDADEIWLVNVNGLLEIRKRSDYSLMKNGIFKTIPSGSAQVIEQMTFVEDKVIMSSDNYYHGLNNNGNTIWFFDRMDFYTQTVLQTVATTANAGEFTLSDGGGTITLSSLNRGLSNATPFTTLYASLPQGVHFFSIAGGSTGYPFTSGLVYIFKRTNTGDSASNTSDFAIFTPNSASDTKMYINTKNGNTTWTGWDAIVTEVPLTTALALKPNIAGANTITGTWTFNNPIVIPNGTLNSHTINLGQANALYQPIDADLTAIATLSTDGVPRKTSGSWAMDNTVYAPLANPTFTGNVVVPDADANGEAVNKLQMDTALALKANSNAVVNLLGDQTVGGTKTWNSPQNFGERISVDDIVELEQSAAYTYGYTLSNEASVQATNSGFALGITTDTNERKSVQFGFQNLTPNVANNIFIPAIGSGSGGNTTMVTTSTLNALVETYLKGLPSYNAATPQVLGHDGSGNLEWQ